MHASYLHQRFKAGTVVNRVCHLIYRSSLGNATSKKVPPESISRCHETSVNWFSFFSFKQVFLCY